MRLTMMAVVAPATILSAPTLSYLIFIAALMSMRSHADMRGRMLSMYTMIARGFPSIGAMAMGYLASFVGLRWPVFGGAVICLGLWIWARSNQSRMAASLETAPEPERR